MSLRWTNLAALLSAVLSFVVPLGAIRIQRAGLASGSVAIALSTAWLVLTIYAIRKYGKLGAWTLLGMPLALYWPLGTGLFFLACRNRYCFSI